MPNESAPTRYGAVAQALHWVIVALIVTQFVLATMADDLPIGVHKLALLARHTSVGMTILMLATLRCGGLRNRPMRFRLTCRPSNGSWRGRLTSEKRK